MSLARFLSHVRGVRLQKHVVKYCVAALPVKVSEHFLIHFLSSPHFFLLNPVQLVKEQVLFLPFPSSSPSSIAPQYSLRALQTMVAKDLFS